jgi:putative FmdB family regulatory protein
MPIYEYRCPRCDVFEVVRAMGAAQGVDACPTCGEPAVRRFTAPHLARTGTAAFRLLDATNRSASEPQVVSGSPPTAGPRSAPLYSSNPLHRKLPRP